MKRCSRWILVCSALAASVHGQTPSATEPEINLFGNNLPAAVQRVSAVNGPPAPGSPTPATEHQQTIVFQNGQQLRGELAEITKDEVAWRRNDANAVLRFPRAEVWRILLVSPELLAPAQVFSSGNQADKAPAVMPGTVKLPGGDWLRGNVTSPDGQTFSLALKDAAPIQVARQQIEWLAFGPKPAPAYGLGVGAMALEGWLSGGSPKVESKDGTMVISEAQWIGRTLATPTRFEVAIEVPEDEENGLRLWLQPYGPQPNSYSSGTVQFCFNRDAVKWLVFHDNIQPKTLDLPPEARAEKGPVRYRVFYDSPGQRVILLRNGRQLGDWSLKPKIEQPGMQRQNRLPRALCIDREERGPKTTLRLRRLNVLPWNGVVPGPDEPARKEDELSTSTPPPRSGTLGEVRGKELVFAGETIPIAAETLVKFPQATMALAGAEAVASFGDQGEVSLAELRMSDGKVRGRSVFAPALELPTGALRLLVFSPRASAARAAGDLLVFTNGDELSGALVSAMTDGLLRWRLVTGQEIDFQTPRIAGVRLTSGSKVKPSGTVELRNGERFRGAVASFDKQHLLWNHPLLGDMSIDCALLWRIYPNPKQSLKDGGQDAAAWLRDTPRDDRFFYYNQVRQRAAAWLPFDGRFVLRARDGSNGEQAMGPACDVGPGLDRYELRVDFVSLGDNPGTLNVNFAAADEGRVGMGLSSYELNLYVQTPKSPNGGMNREIPYRDKLGENVRDFTMRAFVNGPAGTIDFCLNGYHLGRTGQTNAERLPGIGKSLTVDTYTYGRTRTVLSQITITPWNGELPRPGVPSPVTILTNGDVASGTPLSLTDGRWKLESELGPLDLADDRVQAVEFGGEMQPVEAVARVRLVDGSALLVDRFVWTGGVLTAHHATFGDMRIPGAEVSELVYRPAPVRVATVEDSKKIARKENPPQPLP